MPCLSAPIFNPKEVTILSVFLCPYSKQEMGGWEVRREKDHIKIQRAVRKRNTSQDTFIPNALLDYKKTKMLEGGSCHRVKLLNLSAFHFQMNVS